MPIHQYRCPEGHITERFFKTFAAADDVTITFCEHCEGVGERIISTPLPAMFYGNPDGYHKPSATKRYNTKLVTQKGNAHAAG